jgi:hypothetical protein
MLPDKLPQVLDHEGVLAMFTQGEQGPHLANTWHSHVQVAGDILFLPAGGMNRPRPASPATIRSSSPSDPARWKV